MPEVRPQIPPQVERCINDITAHLTRAVRETSDLQQYLRIHAECLTQALGPGGFAYQMLGPSGLQTVLEINQASLVEGSPEQADAFKQMARQVLESSQTLIARAGTRPATPLRGLEIVDTPAPEDLGAFNLTAFEQFFIPIALNKKSAGVLQIWFNPDAEEIRQQRLAVLLAACGEIDLYFKTRQAADLTHEVTRMTSFTHLLQELAGDLDLQSIGWNVVNYAREAVDCERVSIFVARRLAAANLADADFHLQACSGLKKPNVRSEHAVTLTKLATCLVEQGRQDTPPPAISAPLPPAASAANGKETASEEAPPPPQLPASSPPRYRLTLTRRDPSLVESRPPDINEYFDLIPMNWALAIPLQDRDDHPCGILLFEGHKLPKNAQAAFEHMRELSVAIGRTVGAANHRQRSRWLRTATSLESTALRWAGTPRKKFFLRVVAPVVAVIGLLCLPFPMSIKGNAQVRPVDYRALPAMVSSRIVELPVQSGQRVRQGDVLCKLDTYDTELRLQQARQEYKRSLAEADLALNIRNDAQMQIARLNADKAMAAVDKFTHDLEQCVVHAPFDGVVVGPQELGQRLGRVVNVGDTLIEVAKPTNWEVKVQMREQDVAQLETYLERTRRPIDVALKLAANPGQTYQLSLSNAEQFGAGAEAVDGKYLFGLVLPLKVPAEEGERLKVGFAGQAAFKVGYRPIYYIFFHDFINFLKVHFV
jgi:multidrug resistance efflux pump